jgi:MFS family permease
MGLINVDMLGWQLLISLRLLQGIAFGAEMSSAIIISIESSKSRSLEHGFVISGSALGSIVGSLSCFYLFSFFTKNEILEYAWRFPFIFAGAVSIVCYFLRKNLSESININELYGKNNQSNIIRSSLSNFVKFFPHIILSCVVITLPAIMIIANLHLPGVMSEMMGLDRSSIHFDSMMGIAVLMFFNPFIQELSRLSVYIVFMIFPALALLSYMSLIQGNTLFFFIFFQAIISMCMIYLFKIVVYSFPPYFRVTGMSIAYNFAFIGASFFPIVLKNIEILNVMNVAIYAILFFISFFLLLTKNNKLKSAEAN